MERSQGSRRASEQRGGLGADHSCAARCSLAALPFHDAGVRKLQDRFFPGWDEYLDWNLFLERRSFLYLFLSANSFVFLILVRVVFAWVADHHLQIPRFHLLANLGRATLSFFRAREISACRSELGPPLGSFRNFAQPWASAPWVRFAKKGIQGSVRRAIGFDLLFLLRFALRLQTFQFFHRF